MANEITELKKAMANNARVALLNRDGWVLARETKFSRIADETGVQVGATSSGDAKAGSDVQREQLRNDCTLRRQQTELRQQRRPNQN